MATLGFEDIYDDPIRKICIRSALLHKGYVHIDKVSPTGPLGVSFLTSGSLRVLDGDIKDWGYHYKGVRIAGSDNDLAHYATEKFLAIGLEDNTKYYCIVDPTYSIQWDGYVVTVPPGDTVTLDKAEDKNIFLATTSAVVDGTTHYKDDVITLSSTTARVTAKEGELIFAVFWDPEAL